MGSDDMRVYSGDQIWNRGAKISFMKDGGWIWDLMDELDLTRWRVGGGHSEGGGAEYSKGYIGKKDWCFEELKWGKGGSHRGKKRGVEDSESGGAGWN